MKNEDLNLCEFLYADIKKIGLGADRSVRYTNYNCKATKKSCVCAENHPWKFWAMGDDLNMKSIEQCCIRKKLETKLF